MHWLVCCGSGVAWLVVGRGATAAPPAWLVHGWSCGAWGKGWLVLVRRRVGRWGGFALGWFSNFLLRPRVLTRTDGTLLGTAQV